jgi:hypothetical protein
MLPQWEWPELDHAAVDKLGLEAFNSDGIRITPVGTTGEWVIIEGLGNRVSSSPDGNTISPSTTDQPCAKRRVGTAHHQAIDGSGFPVFAARFQLTSCVLVSVPSSFPSPSPFPYLEDHLSAYTEANHCSKLTPNVLRFRLNRRCPHSLKSLSSILRSHFSV